MMFEIHNLHPDYSGHHVVKSHLNEKAQFNSVWICSPYVTLSAFEWLASKILTGKKEISMHLLTSNVNRASNPQIVDAADYWSKTMRGDFFLKVHGKSPRNATQQEQFMHAKLFLFVSQKERIADPRDEDSVSCGFFGSSNFTAEAFGIDNKRQNCEMLALASSAAAKKRLKICFDSFWKLKESNPALRYDPTGNSGIFVRR